MAPRRIVIRNNICSKSAEANLFALVIIFSSTLFTQDKGHS